MTPHGCLLYPKSRAMPPAPTPGDPEGLSGRSGSREGLRGAGHGEGTWLGPGEGECHRGKAGWGCAAGSARLSQPSRGSSASKRGSWSRRELSVPIWTAPGCSRSRGAAAWLLFARPPRDGAPRAGARCRRTSKGGVAVSLWRARPWGVPVVPAWLGKGGNRDRCLSCD